MSRPEFPLDVSSRAVRDVRRLPLGARAQGDWACTRCHRWFPSGASYAIHFGPTGQFAFVACPDCAAKYEVPGPVVIDLAAAARAEAAELESLLSIVAAAQDARGEAAPNLTLRAADVRTVAADLGTTPRGLVETLAGVGLLASA